MQYNFVNSEWNLCFRRKGREDDDLSEVDASAVPEEVRDWLASTFTRKMGSGRRDGEKPKFKSIVNALRAGMFVERMFRRMSGLQGLIKSDPTLVYLKTKFKLRTPKIRKTPKPKIVKKNLNI